MPATREQLENLALSEGEYEAIVERLGREPNTLELGLFGSLWSEHCGYKHSRPLLRQFASDSPRLLVGQGAENAGVVSIGDGKAVVMKIESHNHPSAIEPYEGAATGVGGIVRDILSMGARPIALLNSLRFGPLTGARNRYLFSRVVAGISGYGNCIGIPDVGGEVCFSPTYAGNPLVNAMCVGLVDESDLVRSTAGEAGNAAHTGGGGYGPRRHSWRLRPGVAHLRGGAGAAAGRPGRQSVPGEGADRGLPRARRHRARRRHARPRRRGPVVGVRGGGR